MVYWEKPILWTNQCWSRTHNKHTRSEARNSYWTQWTSVDLVRCLFWLVEKASRIFLASHLVKWFQIESTAKLLSVLICTLLKKQKHKQTKQKPAKHYLSITLCSRLLSEKKRFCSSDVCWKVRGMFWHKLNFLWPCLFVHCLLEKFRINLRTLICTKSSQHSLFVHKIRFKSKNDFEQFLSAHILILVN